MKLNILYLWTIFVLTIFGKNLHAQDCGLVLDKTVDKFTNIVSYNTSGIINYSEENSEEGVIFMFNISARGVVLGANLLPNNICVSKSSKVTILFSDKSTFELENYNEFNCGGLYMLPIFRDKREKAFFTKNITAIRFITVSGHVDHDISKVNSDLILGAFQCELDYSTD